MTALDTWKGTFGDHYTERNAGSPLIVPARMAFWRQVLAVLPADLASIVEVGAGGGANLQALRLLTDARLRAIEPNATARARLAGHGIAADEGHAGRLPLLAGSADLVFTSGVLIHVPPADLLAACREIHRVAARSIVCIEYFADSPEEKPYRGQAGLLWKRDFGSFWLDHFPDLRPLGYGFAWKPLTGMDNTTWWAFGKRAAGTEKETASS